MRFFHTSVRVAWADTDAAQIVWVGTFMRYIDYAEAALFDSLGRPLPQLFEEEQILFPRTKFACAFKSPARFYDLLDVALAPEQVGERRIEWRFEIRQQADSRLVAEGTFEMACVDKNVFKGRPFPESVRTLLTEKF